MTVAGNASINKLNLFKFISNYYLRHLNVNISRFYCNIPPITTWSILALDKMHSWKFVIHDSLNWLIPTEMYINDTMYGYGPYMYVLFGERWTPARDLYISAVQVFVIIITVQTCQILQLDWIKLTQILQLKLNNLAKLILLHLKEGNTCYDCLAYTF